MDQEKFTLSENNDGVESPEIYGIQNLIYQNSLMVLAVIGTVTLSGCIPRLTAYQQEVRREIHSRCHDCLGDIHLQQLEKHVCLQNQLILAMDGKKASTEKCFKTSSQGFKMHDCDNLCGDIEDRGLKCHYKTYMPHFQNLEKLNKVYLCVIDLIRKRKKFEKSMGAECKRKIKYNPQKIKTKCGDANDIKKTPQ